MKSTIEVTMDGAGRLVLPKAIRERAGLTPDNWDDVFPPRPSPMCGWCDFLRHCEQGRAAATQRRPWDGLADI